MYKVYIEVEGRFVAIGKETPSIFHEDQLDVLQQQQSQALEQGKLLWIIYLNPEPLVTNNK